MDGFPGLLLHFEVAHQVDHILEEGPREEHLCVALHDVFDLGDGQLGGQSVDQQTDRLEQLLLVYLGPKVLSFMGTKHCSYYFHSSSFSLMWASGLSLIEKSRFWSVGKQESSFLLMVKLWWVR